MYKQKYLKYKSKYNNSRINQNSDLELKKILAASFDDTDSYGGLLISHNDKIIYEKYFNNTRKSQFRIFSCTKPICGLAIMLLIDQKKLSLTDTIDKFYINVPYSNKITIWHLLNHESGIFDAVASIYFNRNPIELFNTIYKSDKNQTDVLWFEQYIDVVNKNNPDFKPGEKWKYNSVAYDMLGYIIYLVTGIKTTDFVKKYIFEPLHMNNSTFHTLPLINESLPFQSENKVGVKEDYNFFGMNANIITTLRDYNKFMNNYQKLLTETTLNIYKKLYYFHTTTNDTKGNIFFHNYINSITYPDRNVFFHLGAGDFSHDFGDNGGKNTGLCKTLMIKFLDNNINLIIHQNYGGSNKLFQTQNNYTDPEKSHMEILVRYLSK